MEPKVVLSPNAPTPLPFLSQAITLGNITFCSGQVGVEPETGVLVEGNIQDRTRRIMLNLKAVLEAAGTSLSSVVKANIYLTNLENFSAVNEIYSEFFPDMKPARTCVGVRQLPLGTDVEIECIANNRSSNESRL
ncbi:Endoribonuclease L-PSP/chorismate mutase-like protein [Ilyonectria sp. MPI-CAGE-AT-0026]|nr:Endoribonuclease L-PSP/chorismate mutase-like protein [Ilyonectria sp. MPI-CAGE-AT-0026]